MWCRVVGAMAAVWLVSAHGSAFGQLPQTDIYWVQFDSYGTEARVQRE